MARGGFLFAWERPLRQRDLEERGKAAPSGPVLAARVPGLEMKEALLGEDACVYFTTSHFGGYPAIPGRLTPGHREVRRRDGGG